MFRNQCLNIALEREVEVDLLLGDMGQVMALEKQKIAVFQGKRFNRQLNLHFGCKGLAKLAYMLAFSCHQDLYSNMSAFSSLYSFDLAPSGYAMPDKSSHEPRLNLNLSALNLFGDSILWPGLSLDQYIDVWAERSLSSVPSVA
ncbi:hypothetical protein NC652_038888 [Populus alba x Populus x berolinensis]|nr:hypothetical protein NC652_038888 [Populus alba x Populus x berolinensis]